MKKLVLGIIAVIAAVAVVALYQFRKDEAITTAETVDNVVYVLPSRH